MTVVFVVFFLKNTAFIIVVIGAVIQNVGFLISFVSHIIILKNLKVSDLYVYDI